MAKRSLRLLEPVTRAVVVVAAILCCVGVTGCSTSKVKRARTEAQVRRVTEFWQPNQMYLQASPHARLHVEVDAVEGYSPSEELLSRLRDFLTTHCDKPGGVEIVRSDVIPRRDAVGVLPSALGRRYLNGPPRNSGGTPPAFLYVLFYSDVLSDRPRVVETGHLGARAATRSRLRNRNPHVDMLPYPAMIYMNVDWSPKAFHDEALLHEAGHTLGLAFRPRDASAGHCADRSCLMTASVRLVRYLLGLDPGLQERLCERCLAQLAENRARPAAGNLRFVGPVLVRSESSYQVLNLPHRTQVILGELSEGDCGEFAAAVRAEQPASDAKETERHGGVTGNRELLQDGEKLRELVGRLGKDPDPFVRYVAPKLWTPCAARYSASGQCANAIDACRQAISASAADHQAYNLLAWIKATCPDAAIRDGKEAVAAATRACELTQWQEWNWIDTLAAAWAEVGDFARAVRFQQQALQTGQPGDSEQKDMRERLALYQQSQPFRERH